MKNILFALCLIALACKKTPVKNEGEQLMYVKVQELNTYSNFNGKYKYTVYVENHGDLYYYSSKHFTVGDTLDFMVKD